MFDTFLRPSLRVIIVSVKQRTTWLYERLLDCSDPGAFYRGKDMSEFEVYDKTAYNYDRSRRAIGTEIILGCFASSSTLLQQQVILDVGCGTGSYARELLPFVSRIVACDASYEMIRKATVKMAAEIERRVALFSLATAVALPFPAAYFDGVIITQVLHHVGDKIGLGFPKHKKVLSEIARVLKPQGKVLISTCSQEQLRYSYWYYALIPRAAEAIARRYAPLDDLEQMLEEVGFFCCGRFVPTTDVLQGNSYYDPQGPLNKPWRDGDSIWALVDRQELGEVIERIHNLVAEGKAVDYLKAHDAKRSSLGQVTFVQAVRSQAKLTSLYRLEPKSSLNSL